VKAATPIVTQFLELVDDTAIKPYLGALTGVDKTVHALPTQDSARVSTIVPLSFPWAPAAIQF
jgi:hypothetical protein